jgi:hypothetical protein
MAEADPLAALERGIDDVMPVDDLAALLAACGSLADSPGEAGIRYLVARGIVENRQSLYQSALASFQRARSASLEQNVASQLARISRETARVYAWRGDIGAAAMELLRSIGELEQARAAAGASPDQALARRLDKERAATLAEIGRLNIEAGRNRAALIVLAEAARNAAEVLPRREPARIALNRAEALYAAGEPAESLALIEQSEPLFSDEFPRDRFIVRLLRARCLIALGRQQEGADAAALATGNRLPADGSYESAEWLLFDGMRKAAGEDPEQAIAPLRAAMLRFSEDNLPRHEVEAAIHLVRALARLDRQAEVEATVAQALRRAAGLPELADRMRTAVADVVDGARQEVLGDSENTIGFNAGGRGGRFLPIATLGSGGFGTVQRAIDMATGEEVAIKRLRPDPGRAGDAARLISGSVLSEITTARVVPSRFAARTRYLNVAGDEVILVQEFVDGPTLRKVLADKALDLPARLSVAARLVRGVAALHRNAVVHRDLKPENIILRGGSEPVIIDLGLAALMGKRDVFAGMGTPGYAPPEQWLPDTKPDPSQDVYALGRIIEELGGAPAPDPRLSARLKRRMQRLMLHRASLGLDTIVRAMVRQMTDADPRQRGVDLLALAGALDAASAVLAAAASLPRRPSAR